ncbi:MULTISPECIES: hypothetical protein [unclassified Saccharicrinis]|uniref:hypothetical protein n=1 Tax=unclassified Saccharicrinis TaxID=2646859 RepID=UPI003D33C610
MNYIKIGIRFLLFAILLIVATFIIDFAITKIYSLLLEHYSLPKSDSNITVLSFFISLVFTGLLSFGTGFWHMSKLTD